MKQLYLIKNQEVFQGKKYLKKNKNYFEGWYFKNTNYKEGISFIPGINIEGTEQKAFIQIITDNQSYFVNYDITDVKFSNNPFYIQIKNNYFSKEKVHIDISEKNLNIYGDIFYSEHEFIKTNHLHPNIMGPFSYFPFMECHHAILSMKCKAEGLININHKKMKFYNGTSYMEKDWGISFPKTYLWCQGNEFVRNASFMLAIAHIPFLGFHFRGFICTLIIDGQEFRFTTYNGARIIKYHVNDGKIHIILKKRKYKIEIVSKWENGNTLSAPVKGSMKKNILESISAVISVTLSKGKHIIIKDKSIQCGLEIV